MKGLETAAQGMSYADRIANRLARWKGYKEFADAVAIAAEADTEISCVAAGAASHGGSINHCTENVRQPANSLIPSGQPLGTVGTVATAAAGQVDQAWRCFHCDAVFIDRAEAAEHFGTSQTQSPACQISTAHVRWLEQQHQRNCEDDTAALRAIRGMAAEHEELRRRAEEQGFARGLEEAKRHPEELGLCAVPAVFTVPDVDELAQQIRRLDGSHSMGAGALAEKLVEWMRARSLSGSDSRAG